MEKKTYIIPYDASKQGWGYAVINVRMKKILEKDAEVCKFQQPFVYVPNPEYIYYYVQPNNDYYSIYVTVTPNFSKTASVEEYGKPIPLTIEAFTPEQEPQKIVAFCDVYVEKPKSKMGFSVIPKEYYLDGGIVITADGKTNFTLDIWVEEVIDGQIYRAPDELFIYRMAHNIPYLVCTNEKDATIPPQSFWQNTASITGSEDIHGIIAIDAYDASFNSNTPVGELRIPVTLKPAKISYIAQFSYDLPAIYNKPLEIILRFYNEYDQQPITNAKIECYIKNSKALGRIDQITNITNELGEIKVVYNIDSEVIYKIGCRLYDELWFNLLDEKNNSKLEIKKPLIIPLVPKILLNLEAKKFGVNSVPVQNPIEINPEDIKGWELECCTCLNDESIIKENKKPIPIQMLEINIKFADSQNVIKVITNNLGKFKLTFTEIKEAFSKALIENQNIKFNLSGNNSDIDENTIIFEINDEAKSLLDDYNRHLEVALKSLDKLDENLKNELLKYRYYFVENIARIKAEESEKLIASIKILGIALHGTKAYFIVFNDHESKIKDDFYKFIQTLISFIAECINLTDYLKEISAKILSSALKIIEILKDTKIGIWLSRGTIFLANKLNWIFNEISIKLVDLFEKLWQLIQKAFNTVNSSKHTAISKINAFFDKALVLARGYLNKLSASIGQVLDAASEFTVEEWKQIKDFVDEKVNPKIMKFASCVSEFISNLINSIVHLIETTIKAVCSLVVAIIEKGFEIASQLFNEVMQYFAKYGNEIVNEVYKILERRLTRIQAKLTQEELKTTADSLGVNKIIDFIIKDPLIGIFVDFLKTMNPLSLPENIIKLITQGYRHVNIMLDLVFSAVKACQVPSDYKLKIQEFKENFMSYVLQYSKYLNYTSIADYIFEVVGTIISIVSLLIILLGIIFTKGMIAKYAPAIGLIMSNVDKCFIALRMGICDFPVFIIGLYFLILIIIRYDLLVFSLIFERKSSTVGSSV